MSENSHIAVDFINFIAEKVKNVKSPMNLSELCREFKKKCGELSSENKLFHRLQRIRDKMSEMEEFDTETKVKMMFALGAPVGNGLLIELKKHADIELDEQHRIIKYKQNGNGLQLNGIHIAIGRSSDMEIEKRMIKFLAVKSETANSPMIDRSFLKEFNFSERSLKSERDLYSRYNLIKQQIYLTPEFDQNTKIKMMFISKTKIHACILEELRKEAVVEVDGYQRITKYVANNGSLMLEGERLSNDWSKEEKEKLWKHIAEKSKQTNVPLSLNSLSKEFADGVCRTMNSVRGQISQQLLPKISKLHFFEMETKIKILFALSVSVDEEFLNELRKEASVMIDEKRRIIKYKANNGNLELKGDHSMSAKQKAVRAQKKSKIINSKASETDDETEDYDDAEDKDGEENNEDDEQKDVENVSSPNTKSGRLSKKRYPDNDFTCDFDDFSFDSPESVNDSRVEKETEKLVEMPSNSSSEASLVENLKRKISENPSDEEIKYDGLGESLPLKKVKLEDEEYKPDLSLLSNTTQNQTQNFSVVDGIRTDNVEQSIKNIEEMTSRKKLMKLLRGLVHTLESPILAELQSKIDKAIEERGIKDHKIPTDEIIMTLNTGLIILNRNATIEPPTVEYTSLRDFFFILRGTLFSHFHSLSLNNLQLKLKETIKKLDSQDKIIPIESIRPVLETVFLLAMP